jgi:hypothetical protein
MKFMQAIATDVSFGILFLVVWTYEIRRVMLD